MAVSVFSTAFIKRVAKCQHKLKARLAALRELTTILGSESRAAKSWSADAGGYGGTSGSRAEPEPLGKR